MLQESRVGGLTAAKWHASSRSPPRRKRGGFSPNAMKKDLHPENHPAIFVDMTTGTKFITSSTRTSEKKETVDGVEYNVISMGVTSDSHPFFTGQQKFVDTAGRVDKFQQRLAKTKAKPFADIANVSTT